MLSSFCNNNEAASPAPPPPRFARYASSSGPPPPLSRWRKEIAFSRRLRARTKRIASCEQPLLYRNRTLRHFAVSIHCKKAKEAERRQTQGLLTVPRERMSPLARASGPARAEAQRAHLSAFHRGTCGSDRTPPLNSSYALPGTELGRSGRYPLPAVPKCSEFPRSTGRSAGRAYPPEPPGSATDEATPAGTAFAPANRHHRLASLLSE